jgi:hypothetical protein
MQIVDHAVTAGLRESQAEESHRDPDGIASGQRSMGHDLFHSRWREGHPLESSSPRGCKIIFESDLNKYHGFRRNHRKTEKIP